MKFNNVKGFFGFNSKVALVLASTLLAVCPSDSLSAASKDLNIQTVNLANEDAYEKEKDIVLVVDEEKQEVIDGVDLSEFTLSIFGSQFEEIDLEPLVIVLSSSGVPDGTGVCNSANKTYMDYRAVTSVNSGQYKLLNSDKAYTDPDTGLRMYDGRICIAVGTFYTSKIGTKINLVMSNGSVVECVLGDVKSDAHTDETHRYQAQDGSVAEMIVDRRVFKSTSQYPTELSGRIARIEIVD